MPVAHPRERGSERRVEPATALCAALVAIVALLPFVRGLSMGATFYFRDLGRHFLPLRRLVTERLRAGDVPYWNPWVHEGEPLALPPPVSYPVDLLSALVPGEAFASLLLALHVPLAAVFCFALCRGLGLSRTAATAGALCYALGGFTLSTLNLYVMLQAAAWAPLVVLTLVQAAEGPWRRVAAAGLVSGIALSTLGIEIVGQAFVFAAVMAVRAGWARVAAGIALGLGLAAPSLLMSADVVSGSARGRGLSTEDVLGFSLHPVTLLQVVVAGLFGDTADLTNRRWSHRFTVGFPYLLSLYVGAAALALAAVGARFGAVARRRLVWLALVALVLALGRFARLDLVLDALPALRVLRFPVKAFFTVHLAASLLVAAGVGALEKGDDTRPWRRLQLIGLTAGFGLAILPFLLLFVTGGPARLLAWLFPPGYPDVPRWSQQVLWDAAVGGTMATFVGLLALAVVRRRLAARVAASLAVLVVATDVLRAGAGLNPMAGPERLRASAEAHNLAQRVADARGRLFTCEPTFSATVLQSTGAAGNDLDLWMLGILVDSLSPGHNLALGVRTAYSQDLTMTVPLERVFASREEVGCARVAEIMGRLRAAGVSHLISFRPLDVPGLRLAAVASPQRLAPIRIHLHELEDPLPLRAVASAVRPATSREEAEALARAPGFQASGGVVVEGEIASTGARGEVREVVETPDRIELDVRADGPTVVVIRDGFSVGWSATVDGSTAPVLRADGRHRAVPVPTGHSRVVLWYRPPSLTLGLTIGAAALLLALAAFVGPARTGRPASHVGGTPPGRSQPA